jgi:hypothetical protein
VLVVADNARTSDQVRPLVPPGPGGAALVTSRSGLAGILTSNGARVVPVGMLDESDARALIGNRLGAERVAREAASVDRLVDHCAGLPLALAIVAGRAAMTPQLPLAVLVNELDDDATRLDGLCSGEPGSDVRATLAASVSVLPAPSAVAFGLMGLAPGPSLSVRGFTALSGLSGPAATAALRDLTATHLVTQERPGRYRMHDLVRLYAAALGRGDPQARVAVRRLLQDYLDGANSVADAPAFVSVEASSMIAGVDLAVGEGYDALGCDLAAALEVYLSSRGCWRDLVRVNSSGAAAARRLDDPGRLVRALIGLGRGRIGLRQFDGAAGDLRLASRSPAVCRGPGCWPRCTGPWPGLRPTKTGTTRRCRTTRGRWSCT